MKLAIFGIRNFDDYDSFEFVVSNLFKLDTIEEIISGGEDGTNTLAHMLAIKFDKKMNVLKSNWNLHGVNSEFIRDKLIIDQCDQCIFFWDGISEEIKISIDLAIKQNKQIKIIRV